MQGPMHYLFPCKFCRLWSNCRQRPRRHRCAHHTHLLDELRQALLGRRRRLAPEVGATAGHCVQLQQQGQQGGVQQVNRRAGDRYRQQGSRQQGSRQARQPGMQGGAESATGVPPQSAPATAPIPCLPTAHTPTCGGMRPIVATNCFIHWICKGAGRGTGGRQLGGLVICCLNHRRRRAREKPLVGFSQPEKSP